MKFILIISVYFTNRNTYISRRKELSSLEPVSTSKYVQIEYSEYILMHLLQTKCSVHA